MTNSKQQEKYPYIIGLDIGTNSVGWAVVKPDGSIPKFKGRTMAGSVLIHQPGDRKDKRRLARSARRRHTRQKQRVQWIQDLMSDLVLKNDQNFFYRLKYSYVQKLDKNNSIDYSILFDNSYYEFKEIKQKYPTIYHLRKELMTADHPIDPRLLYLAIHHIVKYRGNFLYEGNISIKNLKIEDSIKDMLDTLSDGDEYSESYIKDIMTILYKTSTKSDKAKELQAILYPFVPVDVEDDKEKAEWQKNLAKLIVGNKCDIAKIFKLPVKKEFSFSEGIELSSIEGLTSKQLDILSIIQKVYSGYILLNIASSDTESISDYYIRIYNNHREQLHLLKKIARKYDSNENVKKESLSYLINNMDMDKGALPSYAKYRTSPSTNKSDRETLCKAIKNRLCAIQGGLDENDNDIELCIGLINEDKFLIKPRNTDNGAIPNQFHAEELEAILNNQSRFYPELEKIKDKILSIATFRIPYSVGPLATSSPYAWLTKKETNEKIYPWNFEDVIDIEKSSRDFIIRMTNYCTYLKDQKVLPKNSLLFSEYTVLNELANLKICGNKLAPDLKNRAVEELFKKKKIVKIKDFKDWVSRNYSFMDVDTLEGNSDKDKFLSTLTSYIDMTNILGPLNTSQKEAMCETIINYITIFNDKKVLEKMITTDFPDLSDAVVRKLSSLKYDGWGSLSRKLLVGIYVKDVTGRPCNVMDYLRSTTGKNLQALCDDKNFGFKEQIAKENEAYSQEAKDNTKEFIMSYNGSPAIIKSSWISYKVVKEIEKIMKCSPSYIYIECSKGDEEKGAKTNTRYNKLEKLYQKAIKDGNVEFKDCLAELRNYSQKKGELKDEALYLYFLQNGKDLYDMNSPLDYTNLSNYQVDHILPRCYIKDDSLSNKALVSSRNNQRKRDSLLLNEKIIDKNIYWWKSLVKCGLMSEKKFKTLTRKELTDNDMKGFVNRQIVETSQINKNVFNMFKEIYKDSDTHVYGVSYKLSFNIKERISLPKVRELNDFHHAQDAYTAALVGDFLSKRLNPKFNSEISDIYNEYIASPDNENKPRYGIIAELFYNDFSSWHGSIKKNQLRKVFFNTHDFFINCITEEQTGEFYNQTIYKKDKKLIPLKKDMDPELYGGYKGEQDAYFLVVDTNKKRKIYGIPIRIIAKANSKRHPEERDSVIQSYLKDELNLNNPQIVERYGKLKKYQHIISNKNGKIYDYYLVGDSEVINARQLWLSEKSLRSLDTLLDNNSSEFKRSRADYTAMYIEICDKLIKQYPKYADKGERLLHLVEKFNALSIQDKQRTITAILKMTKANSERIDDVPFGAEKEKCSSRLLGPINIDDFRIITTSITGMFTKEL